MRKPGSKHKHRTLAIFATAGGDVTARKHSRRPRHSLPRQREPAFHQGELGGVSRGRGGLLLPRVRDGGEALRSNCHCQRLLSLLLLLLLLLLSVATVVIFFVAVFLVLLLLL